MADDVTQTYRLVGQDVSAGKAFDDLADSAETATKRASGSLDKLGENLGKLGGTVGVAAAGLFAKGFVDNLAIEAGTDKLAGQLALTEAEAAKAGEAAGNVYRQNWGTSIEEVNAAIQTIGTNLVDVGDVSQGELETITAKALALSSTFDVDLASSTQAVGALIKNGLARDSTEAFDIVTAGFQTGADKAGDFTDTLTEYSPQFAKLGISGSQALALLGDGLKAGARDTDVIGDAFKEFSLRAIDGSKLTAEGFKAIGMDAGDATAAIAAGGTTANEATMKTFEGLLAMKDPVKQNAAGVALFGTQWEDTVRQILPALAQWGDASDVTQGATQSLMDTVGTNNQGKIDTAKRSFEGWTQSLAAGDSTMGLVVTGLTTFGGGILASAGQVGSLITGLSSMNLMQTALAVKTGITTAAQWLWNAALSANPIGIIILAIAALVAGLIWFFTQTETGRQIVSTAMEGIRVAFGWVSDKASSFFTWVRSNWPLLLAILTGPIGLAVLAISKHWDTIVGGVKNAKTKITTAASGMFDGIKSAFRTVVNFIASGWNRLSFSVPGFSFAGVSVPGFTLSVPKIPMLAQGGIVTSPTLAILGEAGPEAVVPLDGQGMGGDVYVTVQAGAVGSEDFLARTVRDAVQRVQNRGYGYGYGPA